MRSIKLLFDYASPWAYLADALVPLRFAGIDVTYRPIYLRGLESFATGIPYTAAKAQYVVRDFARCAAHEGVAFTAPPVFPINGLYALRAAIAAERDGSFAKVHAALFRAAWREARDVSSKAIVGEIAREAGAPAVAEALDDEGIKRELRARTEAAAARGVFGVPSFFAGGELFWGHDRMEYAARAA